MSIASAMVAILLHSLTLIALEDLQPNELTEVAPL